MRLAVPIICDGVTLAGVAHPAEGHVGVLIVSGGAQTRVGAHRGFVDLADRLRSAGFPVLRFDRRGLGDSDGEDPGFRGSAPDIAAAVAAFRQAFPAVEHVAGWGLCDGAAALALHAADIDGLDSLMLANPWTLDGEVAPDIPPRAAVAARYRSRLRNPREWLRLLRGGVDLRRLAGGLLRLARPEPASGLVAAMGVSLARFRGPLLVLLGERDNTGAVFKAAWQGLEFATARRKNVTIETIAGAGHSFARFDEAAAMADACIRWLEAVAAERQDRE